MTRIKTIAKMLLDSNTRTLIKAKFLNDDLTLSDRGRAGLDAIALKANVDALVELATERIAEDKDECCDK